MVVPFIPGIGIVVKKKYGGWQRNTFSEPFKSRENRRAMPSGAMGGGKTTYLCRMGRKRGRRGMLS